MHGDAPTFVHALQSALSEVQKGGVNKATNQEDSGPRPSSEEKIETLPPLELPDSTKVYVRYQAQDAGFCFAVSSESNGALSNCLPWASVPDDALLSGRFGSSGEVFLGVVHSDVTTISADGALIKRSATVTTPLGLYSIFEGVIQPGEATPKVEILSK
jgi:hypothetical protein